MLEVVGVRVLGSRGVSVRVGRRVIRRVPFFEEGVV